MENLNQFIKNANINLDGAEELIGSYQELLTRITGLISAMLPKVVGYGMAIGSGLVTVSYTHLDVYKRQSIFIAGADDAEVPPVPIPNTVVKLCCAEDTWLETTWENR